MRFNKEDFLNSTLGNRLQVILKHWNKAIYDIDNTTQYQNQWYVFKDMFQQFYQKDCEIEKNHDFFGVVIKNKKGKEWLIKLDREGIIKDRHYTNSKKECECWLCEYENICPLVQKQQRLDDSHYGGLGECWKLNE